MSDKELYEQIESWHKGAGADQNLHEFLGWTWDEYARWVETGEQPHE